MKMSKMKYKNIKNILRSVDVLGDSPFPDPPAPPVCVVGDPPPRPACVLVDPAAPLA